MTDVPQSVAGVCQVEVVRGAEADEQTRPDLLFEVPHGATLGHHFDDLRSLLRGSYADNLREFFYVNTDVGAPELALAVARGVVAAEPTRSAMIVRCLLPRTLVDCNRSISRDAKAQASKPGEMTPGLPPWVVDDQDRGLLLDRYFAYREVVEAAFAQVCGAGGTALCAHTYAPRSIDVAVDDDIVASLHAAYAPDRIETWPLRAEVDLITHDPDGRELADAELARCSEAAFVAAGIQAVRNDTYSLHPSTLAFEFADRYPGKTLCFEVRRDLLLSEFVPFVELHPTDREVQRVAAPLIEVLTARRGTAGP